MRVTMWRSQASSTSVTRSRQLFLVTLVWPRPCIMMRPASLARSIANSTRVSASTLLRPELAERVLEALDLRLELGERGALLLPLLGRLRLEGLVLELLLLALDERALLGDRGLDARALGGRVEEPGHEGLERAERGARAPLGLLGVRGHGELRHVRHGLEERLGAPEGSERRLVRAGEHGLDLLLRRHAVFVADVSQFPHSLDARLDAGLGVGGRLLERRPLRRRDERGRASERGVEAAPELLGDEGRVGMQQAQDAVEHVARDARLVALLVLVLAVEPRLRELEVPRAVAV